jgi:hypothetical protein
MAIYDFPAFADLFTPSRCGFNVLPNTEMDISRVNNSQTISVNPGENWVISYYFKVIERDQAHALRAMLNKLRGHQHKVRLLDPTYAHKLGWLGAPVVDGAGQYGLALNIRNATPNAMIAKATERLRLGEYLHELVDDAVTDGLGRCTLNLSNEVRDLTTDGTPLITDVNALSHVCRWADPRQIKQFAGNKRLYKGISLDFIGAMP